MGKISYRRLGLGGIVWFIFGAAILTSLQLSALPPNTTIGHPIVPGVPEWVYTHRVSPDLRSLFILQYGMLYQAELYQKSIYPATAAENFKVLVDELGNVFGSFAGKDVNGKDIPTDLPNSDQGLFQIDVPALIQRLHDSIRQEVFKNNLEDIANSPDLVPSYVRARPTTIGPRPIKQPKLLTKEDVIRLLQYPASQVKVLENPNDGAMVNVPPSNSKASTDAELQKLEDRFNRDFDTMQRCNETLVSCLVPNCDDTCINSCYGAFHGCNDSVKEDYFKTYAAMNALRAQQDKQ